MRTTIIATIFVLAALAAAFLQFSAALQLKTELVQSEAERATLAEQLTQTEAQLAQNEAHTAQIQEQVASLQANLQNSSRQLLLLSESLQEAREMIQGEPAEQATAQ